MICVSVWVHFNIRAVNHADSVAFKPLFFNSSSLTTLANNYKIHCGTFPYNTFHPSWPGTIHYYDAKKKEVEEVKVMFHQLLLCSKTYFFLKTPWHFCCRAFLPTPVEICLFNPFVCACVCVCPCVYKRYKASVPAWYLSCVMYNLVKWSCVWIGLSMSQYIDIQCWLWALSAGVCHSFMDRSIIYLFLFPPEAITSADTLTNTFL